MSWIELVVNNNYEIFNEYPFQIRKKSNQRIIKECIKGGYITCHLNFKTYYKHRIIALQFIPNPNNLPYIDHINRIRTDNRIENLHWVNNSTNQRNRTSYKSIQAIYIDELPVDSIQILNHNDFSFNDYYIDRDGNVYRFNGIKYYQLTVYPNNRVHMRDINNKPHQFSMNDLIKAFL